MFKSPAVLFVVLLAWFWLAPIDASASPEQQIALKARARAEQLKKAAAFGTRADTPVAVPGTNDTYLSAYEIAVDVTYTGNTGFSLQDGESWCEGGKDVWFKFTPSTAATYVLSTTGSNFDSIVSVYAAAPPTMETEIDCNFAMFKVPLEAATTYYIRVAGFDDEFGDYNLRVEEFHYPLQSTAIEVSVSENGNFTMGIAGGSPFSGTEMLFGHPDPWSGGTTLRVDDTDYWNFGFDGYSNIGAQLSGPQTQPDGTNTTVWRAGGIRFTQTLSLVEGDQPGLADTLKMEYTMLNDDFISHQAGVRVFLDTWLGHNDGAPFRVPVLGVVSAERELYDDQIPHYWTGFDNLTNPTKFSRGTLIHSGSRPPNRVVWGAWPTMSDTSWDYVIDPGKSLLSDSAVYVYWNPVLLQPGDSSTVSTYYGLSAVETDLTPPMAVGLTAPLTLDSNDYRYFPNPFTATAFLEHSLPSITTPITGIEAELILPACLTTYDPLIVPVGTLAPGEQTLLQWHLQAQPQRPRIDRLADNDDPVTLTYFLTIRSNGYPTKQLERTIALPILHGNAAADWTLYP